MRLEWRQPYLNYPLIAEMKFSNKELCNLLFTRQSDGKFKCHSCNNTYSKSNGYTNLLTHLRIAHPDYLQQAKRSFERGNRLGLQVVDQRTTDIFKWVERCVMDKMPFTFCERPFVRQNSTMESISAGTLKKYVGLLYIHTREVVAEILPSALGLVIDGWSSNSRHYVAIIAVFNDPDVPQPKEPNPNYDEGAQCLTRRYFLLAFCPLENEEDLGAQSLFDLIADTISTFNKPWSSVLFMVGENCLVNQCIGDKDDALPFIGCASHRFNLAVSDFLEDHKDLLDKIHALTKYFNTLKGRAALA